MNTQFQIQYVGFKTLFYKEVVRLARIWTQVVLPSAITMTLYFIIFGNLIGSQVKNINGFTYMQFITPGLIMMSVITNSYANSSGSLFIARLQKNIEELLVSPLSNNLILLGFTLGGVVRGVIVGIVVAILSLFFTKLHIHNWWIVISMPVLAAMLFSLAGITNALFARKFDDIAIVPTFVLTPLTYLGGVFFTVKLLPAFWQPIAMANPLLYMIDGLRAGMLGISDVAVSTAFYIVITCVVTLYSLNLYLLNKGVGIRT